EQRQETRRDAPAPWGGSDPEERGRQEPPRHGREAEGQDLGRPALDARATKRTPMIKSISLLTRKPGMTHEQFIRHWVEIHAALAHAVPGLRRYVQSHIREQPTRPDIPTTEIDVDGIAELWYDDRAAMARAHASPEAKALFADGALFIGRI